VPVEIPLGPLDKEKINQLVESFHMAHEKEYFVHNRNFAVAIVNVRVEGTATVGQIEYPKSPKAENDLGTAIKSKRNVFFDGGFRETAILDYDKLGPTHQIEGPSIIEMDHACCVVAPSWDATMDEYNNLILEKVR
jgi:N-methylhydantoinase A/oxoprolinase/acetone carboxylase beta subunit